VGEIGGIAAGGTTKPDEREKAATKSGVFLRVDGALTHRTWRKLMVKLQITCVPRLILFDIYREDGNVQGHW